jgi:c-di-GMP-binding flagellar brake protein YcgR
MALQPLRKDDLQIGKPIPYSVYDKDSVLLLGEGCVIESDSVLASLRDNGMFSRQEKATNKSGLLYQPSVQPGLQAANQSSERRGASAESLPVAQAADGVGEDCVIGFFETTLRMGDPLQLRFDDGSEERYPVRLIGALEKRSLLITHPQVDGRMTFVKEGQVLKLKALRGKHAYAFEASVLKCQLSPFPYLHLNVPSQVRATTVRKAYRVTLSAVASVGHTGERARVTCNMKDLSIAGTLLNAPREFARVGLTIDIAFRLQVEGESLTFKLAGLIRNVRDIDENGGRLSSCGVEFIDLDGEQRRALQLFIYESLLSEA